MVRGLLLPAGMSKSSAALAALVLLTVTATAAAESYDATQPAPLAQGYLGVGASAGVQRSIQGAFFVDGGKRISSTPLFVHGQLVGGVSGDAEGASYVQMRVGVEGRGCVLRQSLCAFAGADTGYQRDHVREDLWFSDGIRSVDAHDLILVPRVGVEAGNKIRARMIVELPMYRQLDATDSMELDARGVGMAFAFAVAGVF